MQGHGIVAQKNCFPDTGGQIMDFNYNTIKMLAHETGRKVTDLIALASQNDPFYQGSPKTLALAEWFADFYHSNYAPGTRVHVRRCHYKIVSLRLPLPNGTPYENTMECWATLLQATKAARYNRLVDIYSFDDRKNDEPYDRSRNNYNDPSINVQDYLYSSDLQLPDFPDYPSYSLYDYEANQPYHLEVWCEKTTMNDILTPLCDRYGMVLQTGAGELSITATANLARRLEAANKPARIFYISDFDPAGQSMPAAVARKLEYFVRKEGLEVDARLFPVVLTAEQVRRYNLPRIPVKDSDLRRERFERHHGTDASGNSAVELDALEALRPGELQRILTRYIESYYDVDLEQRTRQRKQELAVELNSIKQQILDRYADRIKDVREELEGIRADFTPRMETYSEHLQELWQDISADMEEEKSSIEEWPIPEGYEGQEIGDGLYNTERSYLDQIDVYKQFQGKVD
jgi:hypothetical protein